MGGVSYFNGMLITALDEITRAFLEFLLCLLTTLDYGD
jgi:hypothetical protein